MAQPQIHKGRKTKEVFEDYEGFIEKFKPKKTTDDCMTPPEVYEAVADYVIKTYGVRRENIIRPFWPGGDYEKEEYKPDTVVVDNPPFSILSKIIRFYCQNNIKFFLFAPCLTLFNTGKDCDVTYIVANILITYENGACVNTSFVTNLEKEYRVKTAPVLFESIKKINEKQKQEKRKLPVYKYDYHIVTAARIKKFSECNINIKNSDCIFTTDIDAMKEIKKTPFGGAFLISDETVEEIKRAEKEKEKREKEKREKEKKEKEKEIYIVNLSDREKEIIKNLGRREENDSYSVETDRSVG